MRPTIRLATPVSKIGSMRCPLMADVALRPTFNTTELERLRKERLTTLLQTRDDPGSLASAMFARMVFGPRHRYGTLMMGNDASNGEMTAAEMREFYTKYYQPQNAHLIVVGDVTAAGILPKLEKAFGGWKNGAAPAKPAVRDGHATWSTPDLSGGQARRRAIADQNRLGWRAAVHAGLLRARRRQHGARRIVLVPPEHEPARGARLFVRRRLVVRHASVGRAVHCVGGRAERQDGRIAAGILQGAERDSPADFSPTN
jgi:hypothetical protein